MAADLQARGIRPGDKVALLSPTTRALVTAIQATWLAGATIVVLPLPMRLSSIEEFVAQTRQRIHGADASIVLDRPAAGRVRRARAGRPADGRPLRAGPRRRRRLDAPAGRPRPAGHPAVHQRVDVRPQGRDAARQGAVRQPRRHRPGRPARHRRRRPRVVAAAVPRHGPGRAPDPGDVDRHPPGARRPAGLHRPPRPLDGVDLPVRRHGHRRPQLLVRPRHPQPEAVRAARPVPPAHRPQRRRAGRPRPGRRLHRGRPPPRACSPGAVFPAFGMAEVGIAGAFPEPLSGLRTDCVDRRVLETERYAAPVDPGDEGSRRFALLGSRSPASRCASSSPTPATCCRTARSASSRSAAPR